MIFNKKGKLSPRYVGAYELLQQVRKVTYELKLPSELSWVHPMFHVAMLKKCIGDIESILPFEGSGVDESLSYEEILVKILHLQVKKFREKEGVSVKDLWRNHLFEIVTWEAEADMKIRYPNLFPQNSRQS